MTTPPDSPVEPFDPDQFWEDRLTRGFDLQGVGWEAMGLAYNRWLYRVRRRVFLRMLRPHAAEYTDGRVLDVGAGTGFYIDRWAELGAGEVSGADLTRVAVTQLADRYPQRQFHQLDIGSADATLPGDDLDVVSCMDVLFHIVDDQRYRQAFRNFHQMLKPGGMLVISEHSRSGETLRGRHDICRSREQRDEAIEEGGFEVIRRRPMFVTMIPLVNPRPRLLNCLTQLTLQTLVRYPRLGMFIGPALYPLELLLTRLLTGGYSIEMLLCRRR